MCKRLTRGYTLLAVLALLALCGLGLTVVGPAWSQQARREREQDLLRLGALYAAALERYRAMSPGSARHYPAQLDLLLQDTRFVGTVRHLRKLYGDPVNAGRPWGLVRDAAGGIVGVYSQSGDEPLAQGPQAVPGRILPAARRYSDWKFIAKASP